MSLAAPNPAPDMLSISDYGAVIPEFDWIWSNRSVIQDEHGPLGHFTATPRGIWISVFDRRPAIF
jgi:hypothetical protein